MTTTVLLYGVLGKKFGKYWKLNVKSPAEAIRALRANIGEEFFKALVEHSPGFHIVLGKKEAIGNKEIPLPSGKSTIRIVPAVSGAKSGLGQIILGGLIIAAVFFSGGALSPALTSALYGLGTSLVIGGVSQMLFSTPKTATTGPSENPNNLPSYTFDGPVNTTAQGQPVAIGYGRLRVGSAVIDAGLYSEQINSSADVSNPNLATNTSSILRMGNGLVGRVVA